MKPMLVAEAVDPRAAGASAIALDLSMPRQAGATTRQRDLPELAARAAIVLLFTLMAYRIGVNYLETGRLTGLLLLASEALVVVLTVFRRAAGGRRPQPARAPADDAVDDRSAAGGSVGGGRRSCRAASP